MKTALLFQLHENEHAPLVLGRNGNVIPTLPSSTSVSRIGNIAMESKFDGYQIVEGVTSQSDLFDWYAKAAEDRRTLFLIANPVADTFIRLTEIKRPGNLKTISMLMDIQCDSEQQALFLLSIAKERYGDAFILANGFNRWLTAKYQKITERALRSKSKLDDWFYHVPYGSANIHNVAYEGRNNRKIMGVDFNAMYASVLSKPNYPHPARLKKSNDGVGMLDRCVQGDIAGAFVCEVTSVPSWLAKSMMLIASYGEFNLDVIPSDRPIQLILHANEIQFLSAHTSIRVLHGIYSTELIAHPLAFIADKAYVRRQQDDVVEKRLAKKELLLLHASSIKSSKASFDKSLAVNELGVHPESFAWDDKITVPRVDVACNVYSLNRQVLANARVKLWELIAKVHEHLPEAVLCYANVDSLHYSIPSSAEQTLKDLMPLGVGMGEIKLEFIGDKGLWLDRGRWWVSGRGKLVAFRSGSERISPDFKRMAFHCEFRKTEKDFYVTQPIPLQENFMAMSLSMANSMRGTLQMSRSLFNRFMREVEF